MLYFAKAFIVPIDLKCIDSSLTNFGVVKIAINYLSLGRHDIQQNDTQKNGTQQNDKAECRFLFYLLLRSLFHQPICAIRKGASIKIPQKMLFCFDKHSAEILLHVFRL
jgi:hypothetical protein